MSTKIVGLIGPKQAGKTTVFEMLRDGQRVNEITLAGFLKDVCCSVFNVPRYYMDEQAFKERQLDSPRMITGNALAKITMAYEYMLVQELDITHAEHIGKLLYTPREIAQYVGTNILRAARESIHLDVAEALIKKDCLNVITDIRFPNELDWAMDKGGKTWYIYRPEADASARRADHPSERGVPELKAKANLVINNIHDLDYLRKEVEFAITTLFPDRENISSV
jgi:dephospho-CoA kinase